MNRRRFLRTTTLTAGALSLSAQDLFAWLLHQPSWNIRMINEETGLFTMNGGAMLFVKTSEGYIVVDSQFANNSTILIGELNRKGEALFPLLINTHHHLDHTSGNLSFKGVVQHVLAHENSKLNQQKVAAERNIEDKQLYPDETYSKYYRRKVGRETVHLHYFGAAHTNGDSVVFLERANLVHMGDLLFNRIYPNIDRKAGASIRNWIKVLEQTYKSFSRKTQFICGHGQKADEVVVGREFLKQQQFYLENLLAFVGKEIKSGKTKEEIIQLAVIPGVDDWKDQFRFAKVNLTAAYEELTGE